MGLFRKLGALFGVKQPIDELVRAYPASTMEANVHLAAYPPKTYLADKGVHAYRTEFMIAQADVKRIIDIIDAEFTLPSHEPFHEGSTRKGDKSIHYSLRPEFGGAVVTIITNSTALLQKVDAANLRPPPPWLVFPDADPSALGSLQGSMAYWWEWFFLPFWRSAGQEERMRYLEAFCASEDWREFVELHERENLK
jgi:hypothetical protein